MPRWPKERPISGTIRRRSVSRKYGPPRESWTVSWYYPPGKSRQRGFPNQVLAEEFLARVRVDPELASGGERYKREIAADRARRTAHDVMLRSELPLTAAERKKRVPPRRSPYRTKPLFAKLGRIDSRPSAKGLRWRVNGWDKDGIRRSRGGFASEREARAWRDAKTRELALKEVEGTPAVPNGGGSPEMLATIAMQRATIERLTAQAGALTQTNNQLTAEISKLRKEITAMREASEQSNDQHNRHMVDLKRGLRINNMDPPHPTRRKPQG